LFICLFIEDTRDLVYRIQRLMGHQFDLLSCW